MITPQDIKEKTFEKAVFGGYDMTAVDAYLEDVSNGYLSLQNEVNAQKKELSAHQKEVEILKSKMKVLVEKIEEYRRTEDEMSRALLSAQKAGAEIEEEAKQKSDAMILEAGTKAEELTDKAKTEVITEQARLVEAKQRSVEFIEQMRSLCTKQLDFFDNLGDMQLDDLAAERLRVEQAILNEIRYQPPTHREPAHPGAAHAGSTHPGAAHPGHQPLQRPVHGQNTGSIANTGSMGNTGSINHARQNTGPVSQNTMSNTSQFGSKPKIPQPNAQYGSTVSTIEESLTKLSPDSEKDASKNPNPNPHANSQPGSQAGKYANQYPTKDSTQGFDADVDTTRFFDISGQKPDLSSTTRSKFKFEELPFEENFDTKA